mmetsp:Transcript_36815/g.102838  ORF Transcript_36815/g.102838 Transcript_36815/m.102838 type:complete len:266 (+) Transcript_36815:207-1004(+)
MSTLCSRSARSTTGRPQRSTATPRMRRLTGFGPRSCSSKTWKATSRDTSWRASRIRPSTPGARRRSAPRGRSPTKALVRSRACSGRASPQRRAPPRISRPTFSLTTLVKRVFSARRGWTASGARCGCCACSASLRSSPQRSCSPWPRSSSRRCARCVGRLRWRRAPPWRPRALRRKRRGRRAAAPQRRVGPTPRRPRALPEPPRRPQSASRRRRGRRPAAPQHWGRRTAAPRRQVRLRPRRPRRRALLCTGVRRSASQGRGGSRG